MEDSETRWGLGWGLRLFMWACFGAVLVIGVQLAVGGERTIDHVGGWVMLSVAPILTWLLTLRPYVKQTSTVLEIQNPVRFHRVPLAQVQDTALLNTGLGISLADGRQVVAWALQQGLLLTVLGWDSRAARAESQILRAARARPNHALPKRR